MSPETFSSGITTSVIGALKRGLYPIQDELGIYVCGGRGRHSRKTPEELQRVGERTGVDADSLARELEQRLDRALGYRGRVFVLSPGPSSYRAKPSG